MSVPGFPASVPPPLPPGWTEHIGPGGQVYYHSVITKESTYVRPLPTFAALAQAQAAPPKKKEKPLVKTPIPGTDWIRVKTNQGNVFYTHKVKKESIWTVPEEIKDAVDALERQEEEDKQKSELEREQEAKRKAEEDEISRIRAEVEGAFKKKEAEAAKRKAEEDVPLDEVVVTKKARVDDEEEDEGGDESDESEEEEWQKEAAAQLAAEAEEEKRIRTEEEERAKKAEEAEKASFKESMVKLNMPDRVDLSIEEGKALFKTLLREKDVNPLHPWDTSLPLFISDPRYVLLPSVSARREAFDEYCRERARELRASRVKKEKEDPKEEFERLLMEEVKSTRTSWNDFRRTWKKDRRFYGWGRDEREREKRFRDFLKELGERKRAAAQKAEIDFFALLKESGVATAGAIWKDVKRGITTDPRYDAVGSSSLREELFNAFLKAQSSRESADPVASSSSDKPPVEDEAEKAKKRQERKEQAVKEREEKIKAERNRVDAEINKSRMGLNREEGELEFRTLLTDAIREPQATWDSSVSQLETDPRFTRSVLPLNHQLHLFHTHVGQLRARHLDNLHALFQAGAPSLATPFSALPLESILNSLPATKLGFDAHMLEQEFDKWQRERTTEARKAFDEMLHENAFVEFWGRLGKIGGEGADGGVKRDEDFDEDEGEAGGGNVDMKTLAKNVDITDIQKVLKSEKRYLMFDHVPEQRERWLRDYLSGLSAPVMSVHLREGDR